MYHEEPLEPVVQLHHSPSGRRRSGGGAARRGDLVTHYQLHAVVDYLLDRDEPLLRVALQFPDELLGDAVAVVRTLGQLLKEDGRYAAMQTRLAQRIERERAARPELPPTQDARLGATALRAQRAATVAVQNPNQPTSLRLFVTADSTFASCCPDEITAEHYHSECIVHFGDACMSRSTRLPVFYVHPLFGFAALTSGGADTAARSGECAAAACVVAEVVRRLSDALAARLRGWQARAPMSCDGADAAKADAVRVQLVVVGTHQTRALLRDAAARVAAPQDDVLSVTWCGYDEATDGLAAGQDRWHINGVHFPRQTSAVQHLLFVGPSTSLFPLVHLFAVQAYNFYHYTDAQRALLEADEDDDNIPPTVSVLDDCFGLDTRGPDGALDAAAIRAWVAEVLRPETRWAALRTAAAVRAADVVRRRVRQREFNVEAVRASGAVGIVVGTLSIAGYDEVTWLLHRLLQLYGRRSYVIYIGHLNEFKLANFVDTVDCVVVVACPNSRESHFPDRGDGYLKPMVSPAEVLLALTATSTSGDHNHRSSNNTAATTAAGERAAEHTSAALYGMPALYSTSLAEVLPALRAAVAAREAAVRDAGTAPGTALVSALRGEARRDARAAESAALIRAPAASALAVQMGDGDTALARLYARSYVGLDPRLGETAVQRTIVEGRHGVARGYANEREEQSGPGNTTHENATSDAHSA